MLRVVVIIAALAVGCEDRGGGAAEQGGGETGGAMDGPGSGSEGGSGSDGGSDSGDAGGSGPDLDAIEAACEADCEAQFATECAPVNQNVLTCKLSCAVATVQLGEFCLGEYRDVVQCRADGGYDCAYEYPTPRSTCATEQVAYTECLGDLGCKRWCADAVAGGCGGASVEGCIDTCLAHKDGMPEYCGVYLDGYRLCEAQLGIECVGGVPTTSGDCGHAAARVGECINDEVDDVCLGYCWVADEIGCGGGCMADCSSRLSDATCGERFASLVDCELRHGDFVCTDGRLTGIDICDYENTEYEACLGT